MDKIYFVNKWNSVKRDLVWSGTPYSLLKALKQLINIVDISISSDYRDGLLFLRKKLYNRLFHTNEFKIFDLKLEEKKINNNKLVTNIPTIIFMEYRSDIVSDSYVYQDLSVDFIARQKEQVCELVKYTPLPVTARKKEIDIRSELARRFYNECKGIFTMSEWLKKDLVENTGIDSRKVHYVGGGCNINITKINYAYKTGNKFLFVGKDWERKNGPLVVEAFQRLHNEYKQAELYVAGPSEMPMEMDGIDGITFLGMRGYDELIDYYNLCDYFVMPSKFEAYGLVFAEALIYGLPCIGKNCYAMPEFIQHGMNGYVMEHNSVEELLSYMKTIMINDNNMSQFVRSECNNYISTYSWDAVAARMIDVFIADGY